MKRIHAHFALCLLLATSPAALAQITTVPMKGVGNEWVKELDLRGRMDWEWIETYPEQVYFATRHDSKRAGDIVTMWIRLEYKHPQHPLAHKSALSRDDWDCRKRQRSTSGVFFYRWNYLQDDKDSPEHSTNLLRSWEKIEPGTVGETLLEFACSIQNVGLKGTRPFIFGKGGPNFEYEGARPLQFMPTRSGPRARRGP